MVTSLPEKAYATCRQVRASRVAVPDVIGIGDLDGDAEVDVDVIALPA